jgi:hypothetical protein
MSRNTALAANLGSGALQGLDSAGVNLKQSQDIQYTIADAQIQIMDDKSVAQVTGQGNCGKYVSDHPGMRLIRGTVLGKMTFTVKVDNPATVKARLAKIGGFSIKDNPGSSMLSISDNESQPIVELLSEFGTSQNASVSPTTPRPVAAAVSSRSPASVDGDLRTPSVGFVLSPNDRRQVRLCHYPHDERMTRTADRDGIMVWSEIPNWQGISFDKPEVYAKDVVMLNEMIRRDRNKASPTRPAGSTPPAPSPPPSTRRTSKAAPPP